MTVRPSRDKPITVSGIAARRLAAIYRQHRPDQPELIVPPHVTEPFSAETYTGLLDVPRSVQTAVLDAPLEFCAGFASSALASSTDWQSSRDIHSELYVTCKTLRRLQLIHGSLVEVLTHAYLLLASDWQACIASADTHMLS